MRKGILILGIVLVILGVLALGVAGVAYNNYLTETQQIANNPFLDTSANRALVGAAFADAVGGFIGGVIFFIIGLVLTIIGFKGKSKKEKMSGQNQ